MNCPISVEDAKNALEIYGPSIASLKSKTVQRAPEVIVTDIVTVEPQRILDLHYAVTLCVVARNVYPWALAAQ